ncbi:MAG: tetratricopeptide repeat protein [Burkholderiales bacterium]|nr:tetratricopeptide repeat protein [Burkholderiales bacterium]
MRNLLIAILAALLSVSAFADIFQDRVDEALAKGDPAAVVKELENDSYRGNIKAAYQLGLFYREGKMVPRNDAVAMEWLEQAASTDWIRYRFKLGMAEAQYELGVMRRDGLGKPADAQAAAEWFELAANQGHTLAQISLAEMYLKGQGVSADPAQAYFWSSIAAYTLTGSDLERPQATSKAAKNLLTAEQVKELDESVETWYPRSI